VIEVACHVAGDIHIPELRAKSLERLRRALSFPNPDFVQAKRRGVETNGMQESIEALVELPDGGARVPRGCLRAIRKQLAEDDAKPRYVDERSAGDAVVFPRNDALERARYYQRGGVDALASSTQGTIVIPCGGGKTSIGIAAIGHLSRAALVSVHTEDLLDQWVGAARAMLGVEPGTVKNGEGDGLDRPVVVGMALTLVRLLETPWGRQWCRRFGVFIVDEAHHAPCETFQRALVVVPAKYRLGLTATPEREDGCERLMDWSFGDRLLEVEAKELFEAGFLVKPTVEFIESGWTFPYKPKPERAPRNWESKRITAMTRKLVSSTERNAIIRDIVVREVKAGETFLVLSNNKAHCRALSRMIWDAGVEAHVLVSTSGKAAKETRQKIIQGMRDGAVKCVIATSLADEGLDVKPLSRVLLALPERARAKTIQRVGRLMRIDGDKKPILYDVIDSSVDTLDNRASERRTVYRDLGLL